MACMNLSIGPIGKLMMSVAAAHGASLTAAAQTPSVLTVADEQRLELSLERYVRPKITVTPVSQATLAIGEKHPVSGGAFVVHVTPVGKLMMSVAAVQGASLTAAAQAPSVLTATGEQRLKLSHEQETRTNITVVPVSQATLSVKEICSVSGGTIVVLAASDGPLRTRDGGYFLLNPATNPPGA